MSIKKLEKICGLFLKKGEIRNKLSFLKVQLNGVKEDLTLMKI